jgi:hypothetical protein
LPFYYTRPFCERQRKNGKIFNAKKQKTARFRKDRENEPFPTLRRAAKT